MAFYGDYNIFFLQFFGFSYEKSTSSASHVSFCFVWIAFRFISWKRDSKRLTWSFFCVYFAAIFEFTPYSKTYLLIFYADYEKKKCKIFFVIFVSSEDAQPPTWKRETCERKQIQIQFNLFIYFDCPSVRLSVCLLRLFQNVVIEVCWFLCCWVTNISYLWVRKMLSQTMANMLGMVD